MYKLKFKPLPKWQECREFISWYYDGRISPDSRVLVYLYRCRCPRSITFERLLYCNYSALSGVHFDDVEQLQIFLNNFDGNWFYNPGQTEYQLDFEQALFTARPPGGSCYPELDAFLDSFR